MYRNLTIVVFFILAFSLPILLAFYLCLHGVKMELLKFQNFFIPFLSSLSWCCCFLPFCIVVPAVVLMLSNDTTDFQSFVHMAIAAGSLIAIVAVTGFSLLI
jgi:hypothetical protein